MVDPFNKKRPREAAGGTKTGSWRSAKIGGVALPAFGSRRRIGGHLAGAAAFVANLAVLADDVEGIGAAVGATALGARHATAAAAALARLSGRFHPLTAIVRSFRQESDQRRFCFCTSSV